MPKKKLSAKAMVGALTDLVVDHLDKIPAAERELKIAAMERRVARTLSPKSSHGSYAKSATPSQTPAIRLSSRDRDE